MCTKNQLDSLLQRAVKVIADIFGDKLNKVVLFGSYARGDYDDGSDVDILIIADIAAEKLSDYKEAIDELCGDLLCDYGVVVSIIEKDAESYNRYKKTLPFYKNIEAEGIKIA